MMETNAEGGIVVEIPQGRLRGKKDKSVFGHDFFCFHRIPYAKPPVGNLRFQPPQPAENWTGIRDATTEGPQCPAVDMQRVIYLPNCDEDSLFINVYCKNNPKSTGSKKYPVLAYIHPGGFEFGTGNRTMCGPDFFMLHDVILVTFNYRLGVLGFLSLQTPECPGNYGLKDQKLALNWIKNNISYFGGDPDNITVFGISAGGSSVQYQTLNMSNKGLFKRVVAQSGSSLNRWAFSRRPREIGFLLGKKLGCDTKDDKILLDFLKKTPAEDLILKSRRLIDEVEGVSCGEHFLNFSFVPTAEPVHEGAFITEHPWILLQKGNYLDVPYITGICEREMILGVKNEQDFPKFTKDEEFQNFIPRDIQLKKDSQKSLEMAKKIKEFYFKDGINLNNYINILSDTFFNYGVYKSIKSRTTNKNIKTPTYLYQFSYNGDQPFIKQFLGLQQIKGTAHGEDTSFLFKTDFTNIKSMTPGAKDYKVMFQMTKLWVNIASDGIPKLEDPPISWTQTNFKDLPYLDINENFEMKNGLLKDRLEFWDELYTSYYNQ